MRGIRESRTARSHQCRNQRRDGNRWNVGLRSRDHDGFVFDISGGTKQGASYIYIDEYGQL